MRKILLIIVGSMLLLFSSNSMADYPYCISGYIDDQLISDIPCMGFNPTSKWCKCAVEWNLNNSECVDDGDCLGDPCYEDFDECMRAELPLDRLFCNNGKTCAVAMCKTLQGAYGPYAKYKNLGQCIKDKAAKYDPSWVGLWGDECGGSYWWCDSEGYVDDEGNLIITVPVTWIEACECLKASGCDASNSPSPCPPLE